MTITNCHLTHPQYTWVVSPDILWEFVSVQDEISEVLWMELFITHLYRFCSIVRFNPSSGTWGVYFTCYVTVKLAHILREPQLRPTLVTTVFLLCEDIIWCRFPNIVDRYFKATRRRPSCCLLTADVACSRTSRRQETPTLAFFSHFSFLSASRGNVGAEQHEDRMRVIQWLRSAGPYTGEVKKQTYVIECGNDEVMKPLELLHATTVIYFKATVMATDDGYTPNAGIVSLRNGVRRGRVVVEKAGKCTRETLGDGLCRKTFPRRIIQANLQGASSSFGHSLFPVGKTFLP